VKVNKDLTVTNEDMAVLLAILEHCTNDPNDDGSMPTARIQSLWEAMYAAGDTDRQFNPKRYAATRRLLDEANGIKWRDNTFIIGRCAAKWCLTDQLMAQISAIRAEVEGLPTIKVASPLSLPIEYKAEPYIINPINACEVGYRLPTEAELTAWMYKEAA
jgi:hypothetical protein